MSPAVLALVAFWMGGAVAMYGLITAALPAAVVFSWRLGPHFLGRALIWPWSAGQLIAAFRDPATRSSMLGLMEPGYDALIGRATGSVSRPLPMRDGRLVGQPDDKAKEEAAIASLKTLAQGVLGQGSPGYRVAPDHAKKQRDRFLRDYAARLGVGLGTSDPAEALFGVSDARAYDVGRLVWCRLSAGVVLGGYVARIEQSAKFPGDPTFLVEVDRSAPSLPATLTTETVKELEKQIGCVCHGGLAVMYVEDLALRVGPPTTVIVDDQGDETEGEPAPEDGQE